MTTADGPFTGAEARERRKELGLTLDDVSDACDVTPQHISGFERGKHDLSVKVRRRMASLLGLPFDSPIPDESRLDQMQAEIETLKIEVAHLIMRLDDLLAVVPPARRSGRQRD